jgi:polyferredoxin
LTDWRKTIQWLSLVIDNASLKGFFTGRIYRGNLKSICVPGLNCYSCPGAIASCPIGSLQAVLSAYQYRFSFYVIGIMVGFGLLFGRFICGFLCPFGLIQELLHKIPFYKAPRNTQLRYSRQLRWIKYFMLAVFVVGLPLLARNDMGLGYPAFCKYICPAGTITAGLPLIMTNQPMREAIGRLFALKVSIAAAVVIACMSAYRFFCRVLCPLGAFYGFFNGIALYRLRADGSACAHCGACSGICRMGVDPSRTNDSPECILCGDCVKACRFTALSIGFRRSCGSEADAGPRQI